jgi:hypothetical protein
MAANAFTSTIRRWFGDRTGAGATGHDAQAIAPTDDAADRTDQDTERFAGRMRQIAVDQASAPAGQINVIGLDLLRDSLGRRWPEVERLVHLAAGKIIRGHLSADDIYLRYRDCEYLLIFAGTSDDAARLKCAQIASDLYAQFLGRVDTNAVTIKTAVDRVDGELVFESIAIADILGRLSRRLHAKAESVPRPTANGAPEANKPPPPADALAFAPHRPTPADFQKSTDHDKEAQAGHDCLAWLGTIGAIGTPEVGIAWTYRPIWDQKNRALFAYLCLPKRSVVNGPTFRGYETLLRPDKRESVAQLDLQTLANVVRMLHEGHARNVKAVLTLDMHYDTIGTQKYGLLYYEMLRRLPQHFRRLIIVNLYGVPDHIPEIGLSAIVSRLKLSCFGVAIQTSLDSPPMDVFMRSGVHAVGVDLAGERRPERKIMADLERFAVKAERHKLRSFIHNVGSSSVLMAALAAGISYVDGDRIAPELDRPAPMQRFALDDIYQAMPRDA